MNKRTKKYVVNCSLLFVSTLMVFVLLDVALNILYPITKIYDYSPYSDYILKPNQKVNFNSKEFNTLITTNSFGLRDDEFDLSNENKILLLGDSFTFGHGVNNDGAFGHILEENFNGEFLVINAGHNGYDTRREALYLENYGTYFDPSVIIVGFVINDPHSNSGEYFFSPIPLDAARYIPLKSIASLVVYLRHPKKLLHKIGFDVEYEQTDVFDCLREERCGKGWSYTFRYLDDIYGYSVENKVKLVIVNIPFQEQIVYDGSREEYNVKLASNKLKEYSEGKGIIFIDLLDVLSEEDYYPSDGHWNPKGHEKVALYIYNELS